jgi:predicted SAM-dependent methyltransferase
MSHVIEHFSPKDLIPFLDDYLDRLKVGGRLVIAIPLLTPYFYDDFDHVKPYHPMGILMVFCADRA